MNADEARQMAKNARESIAPILSSIISEALRGHTKITRVYIEYNSQVRKLRILGYRVTNESHMDYSNHPPIEKIEKHFYTVSWE